MKWEIINGIAGIVSALCAVISLSYFGVSKKTEPLPMREPTLTLNKFMSFLLASSGWGLCCLCFLWVATPFGCCPSDSDYQQFYGVILAFPAGAIFIFGLGLMNEQ